MFARESVHPLKRANPCMGGEARNQGGGSRVRVRVRGEGEGIRGGAGRGGWTRLIPKLI